MIYETTTKEPKTWIIEALSEKRQTAICKWHINNWKKQNKIYNGGK